MRTDPRVDPADPTPRHRIGRRSTYDKHPSVPAGSPSDVTVGWDAIASSLSGVRTVVLETYPGVLGTDELVRRLDPDLVVDAGSLLLSEPEVRRLTEPFVGDDPVFGYMTSLRLSDLVDGAALQRAREAVRDAPGRVLVHGTGASLAAPGAPVVYAGLPRWEATQRQRRGEADNLGVHNPDDTPGERYKRAFFVDWRVADRHRRTIWDRITHYLDTTHPDRPKMIDSRVWYEALARTAHRPFRVVPYFDPAPWGGHWMQEVCDVGRGQANLGWCFDCVPEENSLLLGFGAETVEVPSIDLVFREPKALLGEAVWGRFGEEFPIRFDFLDTMGGGNLSLQVHPLTSYIQREFGMHYTQDESYYLLDAEPDATVYLGLREGVDRDEMVADLRRAQDEPGWTFPDDRYVNRFPARRHDHFLIPAGTVHCSGAGSMVLEISATPYIFTFKLWDWDRLGLDGRPRPIHIDHGEPNILVERDTGYARTRLLNQVRTVASGPGWTEERTGLHPAEFIETRRHWFTGPAPHTVDGVAVLNLVDGEAAVVESPEGGFEPFEVHHAETFIVPAGAGPFSVRPVEPGRLHATVRATVRAGH
ncbi:MAG TPA: class I mannose-6-phosphate isomerase [Actinomycetota bacterium]|nr:class I mannose-6-phosphate isomerase [Actinomycetota bacterium]